MFYCYFYRMKPIGLIGGLTYVSTLEYYRYINEIANAKLGGSESVDIIMYSVNFGEIRKLTEEGDWNTISKIISNVARTIEADGAACLLIGANTMHKIAGEVQAAINIPLIHIADATAKEISTQNIKKVSLLGTRYTMQLGFYADKLAKKGIETIIPDQDDVEFINWTIYNEFSKNQFSEATKRRYLEIIAKQIAGGAEGVVGGCTEIPILIKQDDCKIPLFDTAKIHAAAGVDYVING